MGVGCAVDPTFAVCMLAANFTPPAEPENETLEALFEPLAIKWRAPACACLVCCLDERVAPESVYGHESSPSHPGKPSRGDPVAQWLDAQRDERANRYPGL